MGYVCPVCNYKDLLEPPYDEKDQPSYGICPCCGFEFGCDDYPDRDSSFKKWRYNWIEKGYNWFSRKTHPPENWNPISQLEGSDCD